jgi:PAS domain S-box-containing protein
MAALRLHKNLRNLTVKNSIIIVFILAFVCVGFFVLATYLNMKQTKVENRKMRVELKNLQAFENVQAHLEDLETAENGYLFSSKEKFEDAYNIATKNFARDTIRIFRNNYEDSTSLAAAQKIKTFISKRYFESKKLTALSDKYGNDSVSKSLGLGLLRAWEDSITRLIRGFDERAKGSLRESNKMQESDARRTTWQFFTLAFVFFSLLVLFFVIINHDLERRRQASERLRYQASLIDAISDAIISTNEKFVISNWNKYAEEMYGYHSGEALGKNLFELLKPAISGHELDDEINQLQLKGFYKDEFLFRKKNDEPVSVLASITVLRSNDGEINGFITVHRDISVRKKLEEELKSFNTELEQQVYEKTAEITNLLERITDGFLALDNHLTFIYVNKKAGEILNFPPEGMTGKNIWTGFGDVSSTPFNNACRKAFNDQQPVVFANYYAPQKIWIENYIYPSQDGLSIFFKDITFKKQAELALKESEERYRHLIEQMHAGVVVHRPDTGIVLSNNEAARLLGIDIDEIKGKRANDKNWDFVNASGQKIQPEDYPVMKVIKTEEPVKNLIAGINNPVTGNIVWVFVNAFPEFDASGKLAEVVVTFVDITDHKKVEEELKEREEALNRAQRTARIGSWEFDPATKELKWSKEQYRIFELEGFNNGSLWEAYRKKFPGEEVERLDRIMKKAIETGEGFVLEHHITCDDGSIKNILGIGEVIKDANGKVVALKGTGQDITQMKKAEEQLQKSYEEIRSLATHLQNIREEERTNMAREIHDELGQQLTGLNMYVSWLSKKMHIQDNEIKEKFESAQELIEETVKTVRRISTKLRPSMLDDLGLIAAMEWQSAEFEKRSGTKTMFINHVGSVDVPSAIATGLFRIYQESLTNVARHAEANNVTATLELKNNMLVLTIKDDGKGFVLNEIGSKKTLGLFGMRERAMMMGGSYEVKTNPGKGTVVSVTVPFQATA